MLKSQSYNKDYIYPEKWEEEDKFRFDFLVAESKRLFPKFDDWLIKLAVHSQINQEKGLSIPLTKEEIQEINQNYSCDDGRREYNTEIQDDIGDVEPKNIILVNS